MAAKLKRILLLTIAALLYYSGLLRFRLFVRRVLLGKREVCVLALHRVLSEEEQAKANSLGGMVLRERTFLELLEFLRREFRMVSLDAFLEHMAGPDGGSKPLCMLTFDDGWRDNYTTAYPLLRQFAIPAVIFLVTDWVNKDEGFWVEKLQRDWRDPSRKQRIQERMAATLRIKPSDVALQMIVDHLKHMAVQEREKVLARLAEGASDCTNKNGGDRMLTWEEIATMQRDGINFESHSVTHPLLVYEDEQTVQNELRSSKQAIEARLCRKVRAFAYPNGTWDKRVRAQVQNIGYTCAFTTRRGWHNRGDDLYTIQRIILHEERVVGLGRCFSRAMLSLRLTGWC